MKRWCSPTEVVTNRIGHVGPVQAAAGEAKELTKVELDLLKKTPRCWAAGGRRAR
jgi:hypothetical protein